MTLSRLFRATVILFGLNLSAVALVQAQGNGKPQYGAWGFDSAGADLKTKPVDKTQIPADKPAYSLRLAMTDLTEQRLHDMLEAVAAKGEKDPSTLDGKAG